MKTCSKCGVEKPDVEYHKQKSRKDGLAVWCKECRKEYDIAHKDEILEYKKQYRIEHANEISEYKKQYRQTDDGKLTQQKADAKRLSTELGRKKRRARILARKYIPLATNCEECNSILRIQRHHPDYDQPLVVRQLCEKCHIEFHKLQV